MAALPYMQLYIADYLADTMHLSTEEHGAYLLLMFNYWQTGKAIPKNRLAKIARMSDERWKVIEGTLSEFFDDDGEQWIHLRIENDLEKVATSPRGKKLPGGDTLTGYKGYVYFMTSPEIDAVKIGYSKNPWARISEVRRSYGSSITVVATVKTVDKSESSVHSCLADFRKEGEWFFKNDCIKSLITSISSGEITTVAEINNYVVNYVVPTNNYVSSTTATTNTDTDTDIKELKDPPISPKGDGINKFEPQNVELPEWLPRDLWVEWVEFRRQLKKPIKTPRGVTESINRLDDFRRQGYQPRQVIQQSIANEWQGLFLPKDGMAFRSGARDVNAISEPDNSIPPGFRG